MKILFLLEKSLMSLDDGYSLRTFNLTRELNDRNHEIFIVYITKEYYKLNKRNSLEENIIPIQFTYFDKVIGQIYKFSISYFKFLSRYSPNEIKSFHENLKKIIEQNDIDLIHVQGHFAGLILLNFQIIPKLLDLTDSISLNLKRRIKVRKTFPDILLDLFYYNWYKHIETKLLGSYKITTVVSEKDLLTLKSLNHNAFIQNIPNGIDIDFFKPFVKKEYSNSIFFHGTMDFEPNINAVLYIYHQILPLVRKEIPKIKFYIIGSNPVQKIKELNNGNSVIVTGKVSDIRDYISKCNLAVMPMKSGSGMKNKILEAMAMEKPVITNQMGAEAFNKEILSALYIGKNKYEIAKHIISLLKNPDKLQKAGKKNRIVVKKFDWNQTAISYERVYKSLLEK